jgi:hypothetical protein
MTVAPAAPQVVGMAGPQQGGAAWLEAQIMVSATMANDTIRYFISFLSIRENNRLYR